MVASQPVLSFEHNSKNMSTGPNIETGLSKLGHYYCDFGDLGDADLKALALSFGMAAPQLSALQIQHKAQLEATKGRFNLGSCPD